jgi:hypothetical protein
MPCGCSLKKTLDEVREITFEIACRGSTVWTSTNPKRPMSCGRCRGGPSPPWSFCAYAGFKQFEPGMDIGVDLGEEWEMAMRLWKEEGGNLS